jgi:hypothetical protein
VVSFAWDGQGYTSTEVGRKHFWNICIVVQYHPAQAVDSMRVDAEATQPFIRYPLYAPLWIKPSFRKLPVPVHVAGLYDLASHCPRRATPTKIKIDQI